MSLITPENIEHVKGVLEQGESGEFWKIILEGLDTNIEELERQRDDPDLIDLSAEQYKSKDMLLRAKIAHLKEMRDMPKSIPKHLEQPDQRQPEHDPYDKPEDLTPKTEG